MARALIACGVAAAALAAGCGEDERPPPEKPVAPQGRRERLPALPAGWRRVVNARAGFSVGVPPGWTVRAAAGATVVRSGDKRLAVSLAADRSAEGRRLAPVTYVTRTLRALPGYRRLKVGRAKTVRGARYPGAEATAFGTFARTRVRQAIRGVALRQRGQGTFTLVFFRNVRSPYPLYRPATAGMLRTFRAQPPAR